MKKIGFIDYYLDEFHANKYPKWIEEASGGAMKVAYAFALKDKEGGLSSADWCETNGVELLASIREVVRRSDYLIVLSPDNPEYHEELGELPLKSGKPTYIDKTFAPDRAAAVRMFELAESHGTPMYSTSALRFASEYAALDREGVEAVSTWGPGKFSNYGIHQVEPIVSLMGADPKRVMYVGTGKRAALLIDFGGGRQATLQHFGTDCPFAAAVQYEAGAAKTVKVESNFFGLFISNLVSFFETGKPAVAPAETIAVITIIEYGGKAAETPYEWIELPSPSGSLL